MEKNIKAIKSSATFTVPFTGVVYSRLTELMYYLSKFQSSEEYTKSLSRIMSNDSTLTSEDFAYHLQTLIGVMQIIDKSLEEQKVGETLTEEEFLKQSKGGN